MSPFTEHHASAIKSIRRLWPEAKFVVVGGMAVAHHTGMPWRVTKDLDLAITIAADEFPGPISTTPIWQPDPDGGNTDGSLGDTCRWTSSRSAPPRRARSRGRSLDR